MTYVSGFNPSAGREIGAENETVVLSDAKVAFASVSENIDYSTPEGRLFIAMLGALIAADCALR